MAFTTSGGALRRAGAALFLAGGLTGLASLPAAAVPLDIQPEAVNVAIPEKPVPYREGVFWKVRKGKGPASHILGTIHVNDPRVLDLPRPILSAFRNARSLSTEIRMDDETAEAWGRVAFTYGQESLDSLIGPELYRDLVAMAEPYGATTHSLRRLKPWMVLLRFSKTGEIPIEGSDDPVLDRWLYEEAEKKKIKTYALETLGQHLEAFRSLTLEEQRLLLSDMVYGEAIEPGDATDILIQSWLDRDIVKGVREVEKLRKKSQDPAVLALEERFETLLLDKRNHIMVRSMKPRIAEGGAFIAFGAAHLSGEEGVLNLLVQEGYEVTRLD